MGLNSTHHPPASGGSVALLIYFLPLYPSNSHHTLNTRHTYSHTPHYKALTRTPPPATSVTTARAHHTTPANSTTTYITATQPSSPLYFGTLRHYTAKHRTTSHSQPHHLCKPHYHLHHSHTRWL